MVAPGNDVGGFVVGGVGSGGVWEGSGAEGIWSNLGEISRGRFGESQVDRVRDKLSRLL